MASPAHAEERQRFFQQLKPCCVRISQLASRQAGEPTAHRELLELTDQLLSMLDNQVQCAPLALDDKIASYIFFPLAYIFRQIDAFPVLLVEKCVKCLNTLIVHGWQAKISSELVQQILTLLTFIIDGVPGSGEKREMPEEMVLEAFRSLTVLFQVSGKSAAAAARLVEPEAMPSVGHTVSVVMDGISKGVTPDIQQEALRTTQAIYSSIKDQEALASFLPGTISTLTKVLSTPGRYKKNVVVACINTVSSVLVRVLGDVPMRATLAKGEQGEVDSSEKNKLLSVSWLKATTDQVKLALSNMMRLRLNDAMEIKDALRKLSVRLLDECHKTLSGCAGLLVETAMILDTGSERQTLMETTLRDLISIYPELSEQAKLAVYNRMASLPRVMNSVDEDAKHVALHDLSKGVTLLRELEIQSSTLEETLLDTLTDSAMALVTNSKPRPEVQGTAVALLSADNSLASATPRDNYQPVLLNHESQRGTRKAFAELLQAIGSQPHCSKIATTLLESAQTSDSVNQVVAFWLSFQLVKAAQESSDAETEFLDMTAFNDGSDDMDAVSSDLYSYAVQVVTSHTETAAVDWRLDAVALEVIAHSANRSKEDFRPELIDVLFPVVAYLGSPDQDLRQHAIVTLNSLGRACRYGSVSELMVANVDYMVNSVALRLNSLDISPASTQALAMMLRLAGPRLVPYLDDVVESIFGALENYHGYPVFVESLFSVLKELVDQAVRSDTLLLEDQKRPKEVHKKKPVQIGGLEDLQAFLDRREDRKKRYAEEATGAKSIIGHPTVPWKDEKEEEEEDVNEEMPEPEKEKPPNSVTYQLLLRVTNLTQHYLTSPTPMLRRSLLELLATASPALAADEDAFLPLVNAIWPVVISRLYDDETFVSVEACHALAELCAAAGDFLATRFKTEWGDGLYSWCRKVKQRVLSMSSQSRPDTQVLSRSLIGNDNILVPTASGEIVKSKSRAGQTELGTLGQHASPVRQWEAVVKLLTAMVSFVRLSDEMFDQITDLLVEVLERSQEVREALEDVNADAVWLARYERGFVEWLPAPEMDDVNFVQMTHL